MQMQGAPIQRQTARKVRIVDLTSGEWVKKDGMESSYVITPRKEKVARARIAATVVTRFFSEDGNFASITLDDATGTIQAKLWRETALLKKPAVGDTVSLIGKVREYEGDIYIVPEIIRKISPAQQALFRLEVLASMRSQGAPEDQPAAKGKPAKDGSEGLRAKLLSVIEASADGIRYAELFQKAGVPEEAAESVMNDLLGEGICYEPVPGKIKKI